MHPSHPSVRYAGVALAAAGALTIVVNAIVTPTLPRGVPFADVAASTPFLIRQSLAALAAILLMFGCVGLHLRQMDSVGRFGAIAFVLAFSGTALLLGVEWTQIFEVRDMALREPEALNRLDAGGLSRADIGAMIALAALVVGWLAFAISTLKAGVLPRRAVWLVVAGLFATPFLSAVMPPLVAAALGNVVLGSGWIWLGFDLMTAQPAATERLTRA